MSSKDNGANIAMIVEGIDLMNNPPFTRGGLSINQEFYYSLIIQASEITDFTFGKSFFAAA